MKAHSLHSTPTYSLPALRLPSTAPPHERRDNRQPDDVDVENELRSHSFLFITGYINSGVRFDVVM